MITIKSVAQTFRDRTFLNGISYCHTHPSR